MKARNVAVEIVRAGGSVEDAAAETGLEAGFVHQLVEKERGAVSQRALQVLSAADVAVIRAVEQALMSDAWLAWREDVRAVARGESILIPPEPSERLRQEVPEVPMFLAEPVTEPEAPDERDARIAELEAKLADMERQTKDMFDVSELADLVRENEPHSEAQLRWQSDYNQLTNRLVDPRLPPLSEAEHALLKRLQKALYAGRKGAVGMI